MVWNENDQDRQRERHIELERDRASHTLTAQRRTLRHIDGGQGPDDRDAAANGGEGPD
jgi:hypothetical protein